MENKTKGKKQQKKLTRPKIISLAIIGAVVLIFVVSQIYLTTVKTTIKTEIALADSVKTTVTVQMLAVRDEKIIKSSAPNVVSAVKDGSRVSFNDVVAYSFADSTSAGNLVRMAEIDELMDYYSSLMNKTATVAGNTSTYDDRIFVDLNDFSAAVSTGKFTSLADLLSDMRDAITSKQTATGIKPDVTETLKALRAEYESLQKSTGSYTPIRANGTGYYISGTDGYEKLLDYKSVDSWTLADVESAFNKEPEVMASNDIGRLVHGYYWYLVCVTDAKNVASLDAGDRHTVTFPDTTVDDIIATVEDVRIDADTDKAVVIMKCNIMNEELAALRFVKAQIVLKEYNGYRIDNRAIRINDENKSGVYVVTGKIVRFREFELVYATDDYSIVKNPAEDDVTSRRKYINLYDEYVVEGMDLSDGKLIE